MKRSKHQLLGSLAAVLLAGMALMSCSQEDATLSSGKLLDGKYPLVLTAEIDDAGTRALSGKDAFAENDVVGVKLGTGTAAQYVIGSDLSTLSPASDDETIYWQELAATTVYGWYPYAAQTSVDISDQSDLTSFSSIDFLTATAENQAVGNTVKLKFKHQMAKVTFTLTKGTDNIDLSSSSITVKVAGYTEATFSEGVLTGATDGWITPNCSSYNSSTLSISGEVLLVPQDMSGQQFIEISDGTTSYYYTPTSANLEAGDSCTFNINVGGDYTYDSSSNTYTVYTEAGLNSWATAAASDMSTKCTLGNDITMSDTWTPVGTSSANQYSGTFNGNNKTITNLTISSSDVEHQGLIGYMGSGTVKNLTLEDVSITNTCETTGSTGAVVGYNNGGTVSDCTVSGTGTVTGTNNVGGVVGNNGGTISNCSSSATVTGAQYTGGVAGLNTTNGTITNSYSTGAVTGTGNYTGGVVGNNSGNVTACYYSTGTVTGTSNVGGVAGTNSSSCTLTACYSTGAVSATGANSGGIVGNNQGTITACYSSGSVTSTSSPVGGAIGRNTGTTSACYWSNSQSSGIGNNSETSSDVTQVSDSDWTTAAADMNEELSDWHYEVNSDSSGAPLLLATGASSS